MKTYIFKIRFKGLKIPYYVLELAEGQKLIDLHNSIQDVLEWDNDHLYSFFFKPKQKNLLEIKMALNSKYDFIRHVKVKNRTEKEAEELIAKEIEKELKHAKVEYSHPYELEEWQKSANIKLSELELEPKDKFEYLFDYGDMHKFEIEFVEEGKKQQKMKYPRLIMKEGSSREQYP